MEKTEIQNYYSYLEDLKSNTSLDDRDINVWCDIIELLCYTNIDNELFREDLESELSKFIDGGIQLESLKEISVQMGFDIEDEHVFNTGSKDFGSNNTVLNDLLNQITSLWFSHLSTRKKLFGEYYPFDLDDENSLISCKRFMRMDKNKKLYLSLLLTSKRLGLSRSRQKKLEFDFEPIAFQAFRSLLPENSEAFLMGKGGYTSLAFRKNKFQKFSLLADTLRVPIKVSEFYFKLRDTGENGFDYIGWSLFDDELSNNCVFAGQATCMEAWQHKYAECTIEELGGIIDVSKIGSYTNSVFIPYHFKVGNNWAFSSYVEAKKYVLFDRYRILKKLEVKNFPNNLIPHSVLIAIQR